MSEHPGGLIDNGGMPYKYSLIAEITVTEWQTAAQLKKTCKRLLKKGWTVGKVETRKDGAKRAVVLDPPPWHSYQEDFIRFNKADCCYYCGYDEGHPIHHKPKGFRKNLPKRLAEFRQL